MSPKFFIEFPELKADIQQTPPQPDIGSTDFEEGGNGDFNMESSQGMESCPNPFIEAEGFGNMDWPGSQPNIRVGEV